MFRTGAEIYFVDVILISKIVKWGVHIQFYKYLNQHDIPIRRCQLVSYLLIFSTLYWITWTRDLSLAPLVVGHCLSSATHPENRRVGKLLLFDMPFLLWNMYLLAFHRGISWALCCFLFTLMIYHNAYNSATKRCKLTTKSFIPKQRMPLPWKLNYISI